MRRRLPAANRRPLHALLPASCQPPPAAPPRPARPQLTSETIGLLCALSTSRSMYAVILLTFVLLLLMTFTGFLVTGELWAVARVVHPWALASARGSTAPTAHADATHSPTLAATRPLTPCPFHSHTGLLLLDQVSSLDGVRCIACTVPLARVLHAWVAYAHGSRPFAIRPSLLQVDFLPQLRLCGT